MNGFTWNGSQSALEGFGGTPISLYVPKTGLPFFDAFKAVRGDRPVYRASGGCVGQ